MWDARLVDIPVGTAEPAAIGLLPKCLTPVRPPRSALRVCRSPPGISSTVDSDADATRLRRYGRTVPSEDVFPDRDMSHRDKIEFMLEREGWAIDSVPASGDADAPIPRYAYTVGFEERFAFPELCVFGLAPVACKGLFDLLAGVLDSGAEVPVGAPFVGLLDGDQPCALLPVDTAGAHGMFPSLVEHHTLAGHPPDAFEMVQLAWPDDHGNLPWEPAFAPHLAPVQLLLGEPPAG